MLQCGCVEWKTGKSVTTGKHQTSKRRNEILTSSTVSVSTMESFMCRRSSLVSFPRAVIICPLSCVLLELLTTPTCRASLLAWMSCVPFTRKPKRKESYLHTLPLYCVLCYSFKMCCIFITLIHIACFSFSFYYTHRTDSQVTTSSHKFSHKSRWFFVQVCMCTVCVRILFDTLRYENGQLEHFKWKN